MGNLQSFFESGKGQISVIAVIVVFFLLALIPPKNQKTPGRGADVKALTISALMVAAAIVLGQFKLFSMPPGRLRYSPVQPSNSALCLLSGNKKRCYCRNVRRTP